MSTVQAAIINQERQILARQRGRQQRLFLWLEFVLAPIWLLFFWFSKLSAQATALATAITPHFVFQLACYLFLLSFPAWLLGWPLNYGERRLQRRFHLDRQTTVAWAWDRIKSSVLLALLFFFSVEMVYVLVQRAPAWWWLWGTVAFLLLTTLLSLLLPLAIFPLFFRFTPLTEGSLRERIGRLLAENGVRNAGIFQFDLSRRSSSANAALIGLGRSRRVILADTLLDNFSEDEIISVVAHELGHLAHHDVWRLLLVNSGQTGLTLLSMHLAWLAFWPAVPLADISRFPLLALLYLVFSAVLMPVGAYLSRRQEWAADHFALVQSQPRAYAAALIRLANLNLAELVPPQYYTLYAASHPPIGQRIARAQVTRQQDIVVKANTNSPKEVSKRK